MDVRAEPTPPPGRYDVVVPVKRLDRAKTRLAEVGDDLRRELVLAFLLDTLDAVTASARVARVAVVSDDPVVARAVGPVLEGRGLVVPDPAPTELNEALHRGLRALGAGDEGVLALCADLPAVTSDAVTGLLAVAPRTRAGFVADRTGAGTTAYVVADRSWFAPRFGPGSRDAHLHHGAVELSTAVSPLLRCDVDTPDDLVLLRDVVVGRTRDLLSREGNSPLLG